MSEQRRELRILDGIHAGATAPMAERLLLGAAADCDIVLVDAGITGRHAELAWDAVRQLWTLRPLDGSSETAHPEGAVVALGPVRITVAAANSAWRNAGSADAAPPSTEPATPQSAASATALPAALAPTSASRKARRRIWLLLALILVPGAFWVGQRQPAAPVEPAPAAPTARQPDAQAARAAVAAALLATGLNDKLRIDALPDGRPRVVGVLPDDTAVETLAGALLALSPRPAMTVYSESTLRQLLSETRSTLPPGVQLEWAGSERLTLVGAVRTDEERRGLAAAVRGSIPKWFVVEDRLLLPPALAERFLSEARAAGFRVDGRFSEDRLELNGRITATDMPRWDQFLVEFNRRSGGVLRLTARIDDGPPLSAAAPEAPSNPPFVIQTIVGGAAPFIMLADGTRLLPGGSRAGWELESVGERQLVFAVGQRRVTVNR